eukprot:Trichotokara_eunicae@DN662_c0_g1_i1.p1
MSSVLETIREYFFGLDTTFSFGQKIYLGTCCGVLSEAPEPPGVAPVAIGWCGVDYGFNEQASLSHAFKCVVGLPEYSDNSEPSDKVNAESPYYEPPVAPKAFNEWALSDVGSQVDVPRQN